METQVRLLMSIVTENQARIREQAQIEYALGKADLAPKAIKGQGSKLNTGSSSARPTFAAGRP